MPVQHAEAAIEEATMTELWLEELQASRDPAHAVGCHTG